MRLKLKAVFQSVASILLFTAVSCSNTPKSLSVVETGMSKEEVLTIVGEPKSRNVVNETEIWDYPDSSRTVIFRKDTVYHILTSPEARADSIGMWLDKTNERVKDGLENITDKAARAGEKIKDKIDKDSSSR